jgi:dipeptidyl-peptidase-4
MFSSNEALWFSPDGAHLAYATFNDTLVDAIHYPLYGEPGYLQYPVLQSLPYPKAGRNNPTAKVHVFQTNNNTTHTPTLPNYVAFSE